MAEGRILKPDRDFTKEVEKQIPEARERAKVASPKLSRTVMMDLS